MMNYVEPASIPSDHPVPFTDQLRLAVAAYLARFKGSPPASTPCQTWAATWPAWCAEHVRRPSVPAESPTLGFTHLQFEAFLTAARQSPHPCDFALVAMPVLLGLRIFETTGTDQREITPATRRAVNHP